MGSADKRKAMRALVPGGNAPKAAVRSCASRRLPRPKGGWRRVSGNKNETHQIKSKKTKENQRLKETNKANQRKTKKTNVKPNIQIKKEREQVHESRRILTLGVVQLNHLKYSRERVSRKFHASQPCPKLTPKNSCHRRFIRTSSNN